MNAPRLCRSRRVSKEALVDFLPEQGNWSEAAYLWLTDHTNRLIEYTDGYLEVLPMPTDKHQAILKFLLFAFEAFVAPLGGKVRFCGLRVRVRPEKIREPDLVLLKSAADPRRENRLWHGADLALEVVSEDDPKRDLEDKVIDYAEGKIPEYWIVNPLDETITVLVLGKKKYRKHGVFRRGQSATSVTLEGFAVDANAVFDAD